LHRGRSFRRSSSISHHIFPNVYKSGQFATVEDLIDFHSLHIVLRINNNVSAYSRIPSAEFLVFSYFTESLAELPSAADTWSLGRGGVAVEWWRAELPHRRCNRGLLRGASHVVGAVPPGATRGQRVPASARHPHVCRVQRQ
jgi:hypothetical protein